MCGYLRPRSVRGNIGRQIAIGTSSYLSGHDMGFPGFSALFVRDAVLQHARMDEVTDQECDSLELKPSSALGIASFNFSTGYLARYFNSQADVPGRFPHCPCPFVSHSRCRYRHDDVSILSSTF